MRNKIDSLPKNVMEDVLVKTLEGEKKAEVPSEANIIQLLEMTDQQSNYFFLGRGLRLQYCGYLNWVLWEKNCCNCWSSSPG